jgi:hypothetical protein
MTLFRIRKSIFGKSILQKFDGDVVKGPPPAFRDVPFDPKLGGFSIVPRETLTALQARVAEAERRAGIQRKARADKKQRDFEASRLPE